MQRNPFPVLHPITGCILGWRWLDETGCPSDRMYATQRAALKDLLKYIDFLENGPNLWQRLWWPIRYKLWPKVMELLRS